MSKNPKDLLRIWFRISGLGLPEIPGTGTRTFTKICSAKIRRAYFELTSEFVLSKANSDEGYSEALNSLPEIPGTAPSFISSLNIFFMF